ncbi:MAG TPA: hypothetical protein VFV10_19945 [Gammaproteobacteria bacterium]|nr:hypothetical protein [Gammaproteobacteria bacterium]
MYARTIVMELAKQEREQLESLRAGQDDGATRIACRTLMCDGAAFDWWAVGEAPALVTVKSAVLGSLNGFTDSDPEAFATTLAKQLIERRENASRCSTGDGAAQSPLDKPGWFKK